MTGRTNRQWRLARRPAKMVEPSDFRWVEEPAPDLDRDGEILVRNAYLSVDPAQRTWLAYDSYLPAVRVGEVVRASAVGRVVRSRNPDFLVGELVEGLFGWQDYAKVRADGSSPARKLPEGISIPLAMSALGATGLTAYIGVTEIGKPLEGETFVVSAAAGATGAAAGQIAKSKGARVIGIAGGSEKCRRLAEHAHFDATIDYKSEDVKHRLVALCPKGIDVYFDNVGGQLLDDVLTQLALRARVVLCGAISSYNEGSTGPGPRNYINLIARRGRMEGFVVLDYADRLAEARAALSALLDSGKLVNRVDIMDGLERAPAALRRLFLGENQGKQLVKVADIQ